MQQNIKHSTGIIRQRASQKKYAIAEFIFYSNYFYGLCAVALSIEATLQQRYSLNGILYFGLVFIATILYYTYPYARKPKRDSSNPRTRWYYEHYKFVYASQVTCTVILSAALIIFLRKYGASIWNMPAQHWLFILIFPAVALLYYGINFLSATYNLRKIGWLKPFIIGFIWAGMTTIYPVLFYDIIHHRTFEPTVIGGLLFVKNLMFIAVLCIMFDIKDYATDYINKLKTFVVKLGLRRTIFIILIPLSIAGLATFIYYAVMHSFLPGKILLNLIPFIMLVVASYSLRKRRGFTISW